MPLMHADIDFRCPFYLFSYFTIVLLILPSYIRISQLNYSFYLISHIDEQFQYCSAKFASLIGILVLTTIVSSHFHLHFTILHTVLQFCILVGKITIICVNPVIITFKPIVLHVFLVILWIKTQQQEIDAHLDFFFIFSVKVPIIPGICYSKMQ